VERSAALSQRLLDFTHRQAPAPRRVDVNAVVAGLGDLLRQSMGETVTVRTTLPEDVWPVWMDPPQLEHALLNLAVNARHAMPGGGVLSIATANARLGEAEAAALEKAAPGDYVVLAIGDNGVGMAPEVVRRACEPFFTTREAGRGTGLGLTMVAEFARECDGFVHIQSVPGAGTVVRIYLPRAGAEETLPVPTPAETPGPGR
jgi:signal transduction histidine kinase